MKWTKQSFFTFLEQKNGSEIVSLMKDYLTKLEQDDIFFYKLGSGKKFPSLQIFAKNLSTNKQILGIEFYKLFTSESGIHVWVNLENHEKDNAKLIMKIRDFLNDFKSKYPYLIADNPADLLNEVELILNIIRFN